MRDELKSYTNTIIDKNESVESLPDKERIWKTAFGEEYKPDFSFEKFFSRIKTNFYDKGIGVLRMEVADDNKMFSKFFSMVKENNFKLDIQFLESLRDDQKKYVSQIILYFIDCNHLGGKFEKMGKSLLIRMCRWESENYGNHYFENNKLYQISKNFEGFNLQYFRQAIDSLTRAGDRDIYHIISEYNLIKNIDKDINLPKINNLDLEENFSLGVFHSRSEVSGYGYEKTWGSKEFDKDGNETKFKSVGDELIFDNIGSYWILDRNHPSTYKDASGISYEEFLDSSTGIALFYKNRPVACISFYIKNGNEFFINQIQKVPYYEYDRYGRCTGKHYSSIINGIDWQNTLYKVVKNLANKYNTSRIIIQGGENNKRTKEIYEDYETDYFKNKIFWLEGPIPPKNKGKIHLDPDIAHRIYDVFAEGLGFHKNDDGNREKEI